MTFSLRALLAAAVATGVVALRTIAQDAPASAAPAPKTAAEKKEAAAQPEPGVAKQNNINVRGQAKINSEVIGHLQKNDAVTILEEITLKKPKQDEPARWYRIALPTNVAAWVHNSFIEDGKVKPRRLNVRGGPGENYSILGRLERGAPLTVLDKKGDWTKIEPPTNSFGFVAAHLIERTPAPAIAAAPKTETPKPEAPKTETPPPPVVAEVTPATPAVKPAEPVTPTPTPPATTPPPPTPAVTPAPVEPVAPVEKVKKVVAREGILKGSVSIQAPTYFELRNVFTGDTINYVFSPSTNLVLKQYKGKRVIVTGEEVLDERWQNTPVIVVDALQTVE